MFPFTPRYLKEAKHYLHGARKFLNYKRDILKPAQLKSVEDSIAKLQGAMKERRRADVEKAMEEIDRTIGKISPPQKHAGLRENIEVFLVAIVLAAGIKAFFLQPFRIPTGSMQPTVFGIVGYPTEEAPPNILRRVFDLVVAGRYWFELRATDDDVVVGLRERTYANFFTFTEIVCQKRSYRLFVPAEPFARAFRVLPGREFRAGEVIARGHMDTGDQVLVDKVSYNFVKPKAGDVFVFKTTGITRIEEGLNPAMGSQHYIKRLAGLPGQTLRIQPPNLYVNGNIPPQFGFRRVMSAENGYRGYANVPEGAFSSEYLGTPQTTFTVPLHSYFALGDNSYHSRDSRDWGIVPEKNVAGRGFFVYWPVTSRWGLIR